MIVWGLFQRSFARLGITLKLVCIYLLGLGCESLGFIQLPGQRYLILFEMPWILLMALQ